MLFVCLCISFLVCWFTHLSLSLLVLRTFAIPNEFEKGQISTVKRFKKKRRLKKKGKALTFQTIASRQSEWHHYLRRLGRRECQHFAAAAGHHQMKGLFYLLASFSSFSLTVEGSTL